MRKLKASFAVLIIVFTVAGCSAKSTNYTADSVTVPGAPPIDMSTNAAETNVEMGKGNGELALAPQTERKLVTNGEFSLETLKFDKSIADLEKMVTDCGGYVQSSSKSGQKALSTDYVAPKWANYIVRVPTDKLDSFTENLEQIGSVVLSSISVEDITDSYYDVEARIKSLQTQEQSLLDILAKAEKLEDVISLQTALSDVRYQLETNQGAMRRMDNQVSYSTANISVQEVYELNELRGVPTGMWGRITAEFKDSLNQIGYGVQGIIVFCLGNIIYIVFWAAVFTTAVMAYAKYRKKRKSNKSIAKYDENDDKLIK